MLTVLSVGPGDESLAYDVLSWVKELDGSIANHNLLLMFNIGFDGQRIEAKAKETFQKVAVYRVSDCPYGRSWPRPQNWAWQRISKAIASGNIGDFPYWLWWEPDAIPIKAGWLDTIEKAHLAGKQPFSGCLAENANGQYMAGVGVWPRAMARACPQALTVREHPFDVVSSIVDGNLRKTHDLNPLLVSVRPDQTRNVTKFEKFITPDTFLFHPNKDGSLLAFLRGVKSEPLPEPSVRKKEKVKIKQPSKPSQWTCTITIPRPVIWHAVERHEHKDAESRARNDVAFESWVRQYKTGNMRPAHMWRYPRHSGALGDRRELPYLKDVLREGLRESGPHDIVLLSNDDTVFHEALAKVILRQLADQPACLSFRLNFDKIPKLSTPPKKLVELGTRDLGRDVFAFRSEWLRQRWNEIPDFLLGELEFDLVLSVMVRQELGINTTKENISQRIPPAEIPYGYVLHKKHAARWTNEPLKNPSKKHNVKLMQTWYKQHGLMHLNCFEE